jgi:hypothetical protein
MTPYDFAHAAAIDQDLKFPTDDEEELDLDGGVGPGKLVGDGFSIGVPIGNFTASFVNPNFYRMLDRRFNDRGQRFPSDAGDSSPGDPVVEETAPLVPLAAGPVSPMPNNVVPTVHVTSPRFSSGGGLSSITFQTPIIDNVTDPNNPITTTLADILQWDETLMAHGAKLAFLWDDED